MLARLDLRRSVRLDVGAQALTQRQAPLQRERVALGEEADLTLDRGAGLDGRALELGGPAVEPRVLRLRGVLERLRLPDVVADQIDRERDEHRERRPAQAAEQAVAVDTKGLGVLAVAVQDLERQVEERGGDGYEDVAPKRPERVLPEREPDRDEQRDGVQERELAAGGEAGHRPRYTAGSAGQRQVALKLRPRPTRVSVGAWTGARWA